MATRVKYVGPYDAVEIEVAPRLWEIVKNGSAIEVGDDLASSLLAQPDNWRRVTVKKSEKEDS